jgi:hypothetical protein
MPTTSSNNRIVTIWERKIGTEWVHNHISIGYIKKQTRPKPISDIQKSAWKNAYWRKNKGAWLGQKIINLE